MPNLWPILPTPLLNRIYDHLDNWMHRETEGAWEGHNKTRDCRLPRLCEEHSWRTTWADTEVYRTNDVSLLTPGDIDAMKEEIERLDWEANELRRKNAEMRVFMRQHYVLDEWERWDEQHN